MVHRMPANEAGATKDHASTGISAEIYDCRFIPEDKVSRRENQHGIGQGTGVCGDSGLG